MIVSKKRLAALMVIAISAALLFQANVSNAESVKLQVVGPLAGVKAGVPFNLTIKAYNFTTSAVAFNRVVVAYANPDLTVKGPLLVSSTARTIPAGTPGSDPYGPVTPGVLTFTVPFTITTPDSMLPANTIIPIMVTLWNNQYTAGNDRGAGAGGVKIVP